MVSFSDNVEVPAVLDRFLREAEDESAIVIRADKIPFLLWLLDENGQCIFSNKTFTDVTGLEPNALLGRGWVQAIHPEDFIEKTKTHEGMKKDKRVSRTVFRLHAADGRYYNVINITYPRTDKDGNLIGYIEICRKTDPVDNRLSKAEDTLSEDAFKITKLILDTTANALILTACPGRCIYMNHAAEIMTGYSLEEIKGRSLHEVLHHTNPDGSSRTQLESRFRAAVLERKSLKNFEDFIIRSDGSFLPVMCNIEPIYENDTPIGSLLELRDITEEKNAKLKLMEYMQRLEQSNKELEHFATIASHDLQEPLRKIQIFSDHLSKLSRFPSENEALDDLKRIQTSTSRMQRLIEDLLDLSKITRRGRPFKEIELKPLVEKAIAELEYAFEDIHSRVELNGEISIEADPDQMHQMMIQLLDNALKFYEGKPSLVKIDIRPVEGGQCQISVADNGIGIKPEYLNKIFDTFVRLHHGREYPGTGIGLALVQKIIERHDGSIKVESIPGEGSTFTVTLPKNQQLHSTT